MAYPVLALLIGLILPANAAVGLAGDGHAEPLSAIRTDAAESRATGRAVND